MLGIVDFLLLMLMISQLSSGQDLYDVEDGCLPSQDCVGGLSVRYEQQDLYCDQLLDASSVTSVPALEINAKNKDFESVFEPQSVLLLLMLDPDAPSGEDTCSGKYWLHWMTEVQLQDGEVVMQNKYFGYHSPDPPPESGPHRYQLFLYKLADDARVKVPKTRSGFDLQEFVESVGLESPAAASFQFRVIG